MKTVKKYLQLAIAFSVLCLVLAGCGSSQGSTSGNNDRNTRDNGVMDNADGTAKNVTDDVGDAAKNVADGVGDAAQNVADGIGNAVDDLVGNGGFDNYADAHDYFLDTMGAYHSDAKFELRDEDKTLNDYQEGSKGYHFNLYDTSKNSAGDLFGEFYVDATSGTIYKKGTNNTVEEYPAARNNSTNNSGRRNNRGGNLSENR